MGSRNKNNKVISGKVTKKTAAKPPAAARDNKASEIDDIFSLEPAPKAPPTPPPAKPTHPIAAATSLAKVVDATAAGKSTAAQKQPPPKDDAFADTRGKNTKYTDDGFRVFYYDDLRIGEGQGDTELCPFECECCY
ncbi:hypothetical protein GGF46_002130 [Coemansia sp. RSA 552]|nr:hypothetical protein GGF46_002130 [Coemansia sp. RSA 552]